MLIYLILPKYIYFSVLHNYGKGRNADAPRQLLVQLPTPRLMRPQPCLETQGVSWQSKPFLVWCHLSFALLKLLSANVKTAASP